MHIIRPLCRYCGKKISKKTTLVYRKPEPSKNDHPSYGIRFSYGPPLHNKADCQRVTNEEVVSVSYGRDGDVDRFTTWDRESYVDKYFCNGTHARDFGYACVEIGGKQYGMPAYFDARKKQRETVDT